MTRRGALLTLAGVPAWGRVRPRLDRTFLQPWRRHLEWSPAQWAGLLDWLRALSVRQLVLQWTHWNGVDYSGLAAALEPELDSRRMKLWLGLAFDEEFWRWPVEPGPETSRRLKHWRERSIEQASRLASPLARGRAFAGWYLPEEFDAARWGAAAGEVSNHLFGRPPGVEAILRQACGGERISLGSGPRRGPVLVGRALRTGGRSVVDAGRHRGGEVDDGAMACVGRRSGPIHPVHALPHVGRGGDLSGNGSGAV